jgi:hypothetical protein
MIGWGCGSSNQPRLLFTSLLTFYAENGDWLWIQRSTARLAICRSSKTAKLELKEREQYIRFSGNMNSCKKSKICVTEWPEIDVGF